MVPKAAPPLWGGMGQGVLSTKPNPPLGGLRGGQGVITWGWGDEVHVVLPRLAVMWPAELRALESRLSKTKADVNTKPCSSRD